ncbi:MAG: Mu-like prophage major head subunit gpT family protein [Planctomycetes bacterium]|nr:Mu-like prophage major head subunit gpT family protein [Planctomycetota bacterium]
MSRITDYGVKAALLARLDAIDKSKGLLALALMIPSLLAAGQSEKYPWLGTSPSMREWISQRLENAPQSFDLSIPNKKYENSSSIPLDMVNNDKLEMVQNYINGLADTYPLWMVELIAAVINSGTTLTAFDGQPYFSASHSFGLSGTFSNLLNSAASGNASAITALEAANALNLAIETMKILPDDQGRLIKNEAMKKVTLVYKAGTANAAAIRTALTQGTLSSGAGMVDNPLKGQDIEIDAVASGLITTAATKVSLFRRVADGGKPIIFQENLADRMVSMMTAVDNPYVVKNDAWFVGLKCVGGVGFAMPNDALQLTFV